MDGNSPGSASSPLMILFAGLESASTEYVAEVQMAIKTITTWHTALIDMMFVMSFASRLSSSLIWVIDLVLIG